ncbi:GMC family oxidoreductase N-terminal domain-containing protein [Marinobacter sp. NFXS9]|uniref:GMC family oxidoreductase n=1 Tax=Marinobacter sp. NFXS9 TaxID=2818433 RepID=UPI0032E03B2A
MAEFDYIIIGAGAAGCVLAHRLTNNPRIRVALLEAGGKDDSYFVKMPKGLAKVMQDPQRTWMYPAQPEASSAFKEEYWARGRLMGGSSSINGMMYVRGQPGDFNELAAQSSADWDWEHIAKAYREIESHELGAAASRGADGPLRISLPDRRNVLTEAVIQAGVRLGLPRKEDVNEPDDQPAVGYASRTIWDGRRQSASTAFIDPIRDRDNLTIISGVTVDRVLFDGDRAVGVALAPGSAEGALRATREVILAAGALASPGILQRSGIGARELLESLGIEVVHDNAQVGQNLIEHRGLLPQWRLSGAPSDNREYAGLRLLKNTLQYVFRRRGPMSSAAYEIGAWLKSDESQPRPDIQFLIAPFTFDYATERQTLEKHPGMGMVIYPLRPQSHGSVNIASRDPHQLPALQANYRACEDDRALMVRALRLARQFVAQSPLAPYVVEETFPGPQCVDDDQIIDAYDSHGSCGYHAVGSCRMGRDAESVVDPALRVRGVRGLRVVDASIFPGIPAGNTNAPTMAMAWRAADLILRELDN